MPEKVISINIVSLQPNAKITHFGPQNIPLITFCPNSKVQVIGQKGYCESPPGKYTGEFRGSSGELLGSLLKHLEVLDKH